MLPDAAAFQSRWFILILCWREQCLQLSRATFIFQFAPKNPSVSQPRLSVRLPVRRGDLLTASPWLRAAQSVSLSWPDFKIDGLARTHGVGQSGNRALLVDGSGSHIKLLLLSAVRDDSLVSHDLIKWLQPAVAEIMRLSVGRGRLRAQTRTRLGTQTSLGKHAAVYYCKPIWDARGETKNLPINGDVKAALAELMPFTSDSASNGI